MWCIVSFSNSAWFCKLASSHLQTLSCRLGFIQTLVSWYRTNYTINLNTNLDLNSKSNQQNNSNALQTLTLYDSKEREEVENYVKSSAYRFFLWKLQWRPWCFSIILHISSIVLQFYNYRLTCTSLFSHKCFQFKLNHQLTIIYPTQESRRKSCIR